MAILTDGPMLEAVDKWSPAYLRELEVAHQHLMVIQITAILAAVVLLMAVAYFGPRVWRRMRRALAGPARMPDPVTRPE